MNDCQRLDALLQQYDALRVCVIGPTCCGKSTLLASLSYAVDMDVPLFEGYNGAPPLLSAQEQEYVCQKPWTAQIGAAMTRWAKERIRIGPGHPVFGTVALECDIYIYLKISDDLLESRVASRGVRLSDAKDMRTHIEQEIYASGTPVVEFVLG